MPMVSTWGPEPSGSQWGSQRQLCSPCEVARTKEPHGLKTQGIWVLLQGGGSDPGIWCLSSLWGQSFVSPLSISLPSMFAGWLAYAQSSLHHSLPLGREGAKELMLPGASVCSATRALGNIQVGPPGYTQVSVVLGRREDSQERLHPWELIRAGF